MGQITAFWRDQIGAWTSMSSGPPMLFRIIAYPLALLVFLALLSACLIPLKSLWSNWKAPAAELRPPAHYYVDKSKPSDHGVEMYKVKKKVRGWTSSAEDVYGWQDLYQARYRLEEAQKADPEGKYYLFDGSNDDRPTCWAVNETVDWAMDRPVSKCYSNIEEAREQQLRLESAYTGLPINYAGATFEPPVSVVENVPMPVTPETHSPTIDQFPTSPVSPQP